MEKSKIESKIKSAEEIARSHGYNPKNYGDKGVIEMIQEAQRQAIEKALEVAADKAEIIHNVDSDYLPYIEQESITNLINSPELEVI